MSDEEISKIKNFHVLHFPTVMGGVVPTYNVDGASKDLNFTGEALAGMFSGQDHEVERSPRSPRRTRG